jgi:predicted esterase
MLAEAQEDSSFRQQIAGAIIMHPACFLDEDGCTRAVNGIPTLLCWAKDDPMAPYQLSVRLMSHDKVKLVTYEKGGHANFDGSNGLPNFDDEIMDWLQEQIV